MTMLSVSKIRAGFVACALAAAAMASTSSAVAQSRALVVDVPFPFHNGSQILPSGRYTVSMQTENVMLLRGTSESGYAITNQEQSVDTPETAKVTFRKYGDRYFLHGVWLSGSKFGRKCVKTHAEKRFEIAENAPAPSDVELALNTLPR